MLLGGIYLLAGMGLLYAGGEALVRGASALARDLGMTPITVGLTVVAFGTSAPELAVTLDGALQGHADIAVSNVVGSNICNLALVLPLALWLRPLRIDRTLLRRDLPVMLAATALVLLWLANDQMSRWEGVLAVTLLASYVLLQWLGAPRGHADMSEAPLPAIRRGGMWRAAAAILLGLGLLAVGGYAMVHGAVALASALGMDEAVIGLTVVAIGTSMPELATTVIAAVRRQSEIALGNIIGTNIFNGLGVLGLTAVLHPLARGGIHWADLVTLAAFSAAVPALIFVRRRPRLGRIDATTLLLAYLGYMAWRIVRAIDGG